MRLLIRYFRPIVRSVRSSQRSCGGLLRYRILIAIIAAACAALPGTASASQMINRNATNVKLAVNRNGVALLTYRSAGRLNHTLAWGAINARTPTRGMKQVRFKIDYSGGWGSDRKNTWKGFKNA